MSINRFIVEKENLVEGHFSPQEIDLCQFLGTTNAFWASIAHKDADSLLRAGGWAPFLK